MMKLFVLLVLLSVSERSSSSRVVGQTGQNVTLTCKYDTNYHTELPVCWGRGKIPSMGCKDQLISTDGRTVTEGSRVSSRFQLLGRLEDGDVSLTILNLTETDAGRYGCRVEISGWFNDEKHHFDLIVHRAPETSTTSSSETTSTQQTTESYTAGQLTSTLTLLTSSSSSPAAEQGGSSVTVVLVCVLFGLVAVVTAGGLVIIGKRWKQLYKIPQQVNSSVQFSSTASTLQLHRRGSVVENIYQIDGGGEGGEYEFCP